MQTEMISDALGDAAQSVLETMFFVSPEGTAEPAYPQEVPLLGVGLTFSGEWSGTFELQTPITSARTLAEGFVGTLDPSEVEGDKTTEVICELANMVCGSTLTRLAGDKIFDLGSPHLVSLPPLPRVAAPADSTATRALDLGFGVIAFTLTIGARE